MSVAMMYNIIVAQAKYLFNSDVPDILSTDQSFDTVQGAQQHQHKRPILPSPTTTTTTNTSARAKKSRESLQRCKMTTPPDDTSESDLDSSLVKSPDTPAAVDDAAAAAATDHAKSDNEMAEICREYQQEIEASHQEIHYLRATLARDVHIAYQAGFDKARSTPGVVGGDSELKRKLSQQMSSVRELMEQNNELQTLLARREQDAFTVNERLLREYSALRETCTELLKKEVVTAAADDKQQQQLPKHVMQQLMTAYDVNGKALVTCVQLQSIINEQRLLMTSQYQQLKQASVFRRDIDADDIISSVTSSSSAASSTSNSGDEAASARQRDVTTRSEQVNKQVAKTVRDMLFCRDSHTGDSSPDAQQLIVQNFELGTEQRAIITSSSSSGGGEV